MEQGLHKRGVIIMKKFKILESDDELAERIWKLTDKKDYGIFSPCMEAHVALNELCNFFLGDEWYANGGMSPQQVNTEIVYDIERKFKWYKARRRLVEWLKDKFMT